MTDLLVIAEKAVDLLKTVLRLAGSFDLNPFLRLSDAYDDPPPIRIGKCAGGRPNLVWEAAFSTLKLDLQRLSTSNALHELVAERFLILRRHNGTASSSC
jgi:hypothetical protein